MKRSHVATGVFIIILGLMFLLNSLYIIRFSSGMVVSLVVLFLGVLIFLNPSFLQDFSKALKTENKEDDKPLYRTKKSDKDIGGFFSFRFMISTQLIKLIYVLGILALIVLGWNYINKGYEEFQLIGWGIIILGNLVWRIVCEGWILLFSIHDILGSIEKLQRDSD